MALARVADSRGLRVIAPLDGLRCVFESHHVDAKISSIGGYTSFWLFHTNITAFSCDVCIKEAVIGYYFQYDTQSGSPFHRHALSICRNCLDYVSSYVITGKTHTYIATQLDRCIVIDNSDIDYANKLVSALRACRVSYSTSPLITKPVNSSLGGDIFMQSICVDWRRLHKYDSPERPIVYNIPNDVAISSMSARDKNTVAFIPHAQNSPLRVADLRSCHDGMWIWTAGAHDTKVYTAFASEYLLATSQYDWPLRYYDIRASTTHIFEFDIGCYSTVI
jgi:hypothetical protein